MNYLGLATVFGILVFLGLLTDIWLRLRKYVQKLESKPVSSSNGVSETPSFPATREICFNCTHWNYEDGQALLRQHAAFYEASKHVSPARMVTKYADGEVVETSKVPPRCDWKDFGACHAYEEGRWREDGCKDDSRGSKFQLKVLS